MLSRQGLAKSSRLLFARSWTGREQCPCHHRLKSRFAYPEGMKDFEDDYTDTPEYPPITETRLWSEKRKNDLQKVLDWHASIKNAKTVEEKIIQINMIRRYGWGSVFLRERNYPYNCTPFYSFITRTHFVPDYKLPDLYSDPDLTQRVKPIVEKLKSPLLDLLRFEFDGIERKVDPTESPMDAIETAAKSTSIVNQVNRLLVAALVDTAPHLKTCQVDYRPHVEAFWCCGGLEPPTRVQKGRKRRNKRRVEVYKVPAQEDVDGPHEYNYQYMGTPLLQIRSVNPIRNFIESDSILYQRGESIPDRFPTTPAAYSGAHPNFRFATMIPGYWPGDDHRSSLLAIHAQDHLNWDFKQTEYWKADQSSALDSQAMVSSFSRLLAQSYYYGFDQFTDLDYPFSTQYISTNGLDWSFYTYQLNTIQLGELHIAKNKRQNVMWGTRPMKILNGDNLNEEVVENLVKFYLQPPTPVPVPKEKLTPYLPSTMADYDAVKQNVIYENLLDMYCGKKIQQEKTPFPEVYDWEWIYKIKFQAMPFEARRRHFEFPIGYPGSDPYREPYTLRNPIKSMPKALFRYRRLLREQKENEALVEAKQAEKDKFVKGSGKKEDDDPIL